MAAPAAEAARLLDAGKVEEAKQKAKDAVAILEKASDKAELARAIKTLVKAEMDADKFEDAAQLVDEHLANFKKADFTPGVVAMLVMKSKLALAQGKFQDSFAASRLAWPTAKKSGDKVLQAEVLVATVSGLFAKGSTQEALRAASSSMAMVKESGDKTSIADLLHLTAKLQLQEDGSAQEALTSATEASSTYKALASKRGEAAAMTTKAEAQLKTGELSEASKTANAALDLWRPLELAAGSAAALDVLIDVQSSKGQPRVGLSVIEDELSKMKAKGISAKNEAIVLEKLAATASSQGFTVEAVDSYEKMVAVMQTSGDKLGEAKKLLECAQMHFSMTQMKDAAKSAVKAVALFAELGETELEDITKKLIMDCYVMKGEASEAPYRSEALLALKGFYRAVKDRDDVKFKESEALLEKYTDLISDSELALTIQILIEDDVQDDDTELSAMKFMEKHGWDLQKYKKEEHIYMWDKRYFYLYICGFGGMNFGPTFQIVHPNRKGKRSDGKPVNSMVVTQQLPSESWAGYVEYRHGIMDGPIQSSQLGMFSPN